LNYGKKIRKTEQKLEEVSGKVLQKEAQFKNETKEINQIRKILQNKRTEIEDVCLSDVETEKKNLGSFKLELEELQEKITAMEEGKKLFKVKF
jgi:chromosome segregation ATPase